MAQKYAQGFLLSACQALPAPERGQGPSVWVSSRPLLGDAYDGQLQVGRLWPEAMYLALCVQDAAGELERPAKGAVCAHAARGALASS